MEHLDQLKSSGDMWISVSSRLPEANTPVLVVMPTEEYCIAELQEQSRWIDKYGSKTLAPTHWTPLPKLPGV